MAVAYKSQGAGAGTGTNGAALNLSFPATVDANDILIAHVMHTGTTTAPTTPSGWTLLYGPANVGVTTVQARHWVFGKLADGSEDAASISFGTAVGTNGRAGRIYSFSGYVTGGLADVVPAVSFSSVPHDTDPQGPSVTTTVAGALPLALTCQDDDNSEEAIAGASGGTWGGFVTYVNGGIGPQGLHIDIQVATLNANPGTISGGAMVAANDEAGTIGFEIRPTPVSLIRIAGAISNVEFQLSASSPISPWRALGSKVGEVVSVTDFSPVGTNWRQAIIDAMTYLASIGGGALFFPARATGYDVDNSGLGAISWTSGGIWWLGPSPQSSIITNTSTDGTALISFNGGSNSIQRVGFRNLQLVGNSSSGHIWTFASKGLSFSRFENLWVQQKALAKSIMQGAFTGMGGMFENQWVGGIYEHGTASTQATVSAFDLESDQNLITLNKWEDLRIHCHGSGAPFFHIRNTAGAMGALNHQNEWRGINCEEVRSGFARLTGANGCIFEDLQFYDVYYVADPLASVDGHIIEVTTGSGGRNSEQTRFSKVARNGGSLLGVSGTAVAATTNGLTNNGLGIAQFVAIAAHGRNVGERIYVSGASGAAYNGRFTVLSVSGTSSEILTYAITGTPASPDPGSPVVAQGAVDIKIGPDNQDDYIEHCEGVAGGTVMEADVNGTVVYVAGHRPDKLLVARDTNTERSVVIELGSGSGIKSTVKTATLNVNSLANRTAGTAIVLSQDSTEIARWSTAGGIYSKQQYTTPAALTYGANIPVNAQLSNMFTVTLTGATAQLDNPTNLVAGMTFIVVVTQDATGGRALTFGSNYTFGNEGPPALTTSTANKVDVISCVALSSTKVACTTLRGF